MIQYVFWCKYLPVSFTVHPTVGALVLDLVGLPFAFLRRGGDLPSSADVFSLSWTHDGELRLFESDSHGYLQVYFFSASVESFISDVRIAWSPDIRLMTIRNLIVVGKYR